MAVTTQSVCGVIDALADYQVKILQSINGKFLALRRLADLLEQAADLAGFLPNLALLPPISTIDLLMYEELRASCPFLNLPPAPADPTVALSTLQAQVDAAYGRLEAMLRLNPLNRLSKLQEKMDKFQQQFNIAALGGIDFMACLQAACATAVGIQGQVSNLSNLSSADVKAIGNAYASQFVAAGGKVLTNVQENKASAVASGIGQINTLRDVPHLPVLQQPPAVPPNVAV